METAGDQLTSLESDLEETAHFKETTTNSQLTPASEAAMSTSAGMEAAHVADDAAHIAEQQRRQLAIEKEKIIFARMNLQRRSVSARTKSVKSVSPPARARESTDHKSAGSENAELIGTLASVTTECGEHYFSPDSGTVQTPPAVTKPDSSSSDMQAVLQTLLAVQTAQQLGQTAQQAALDRLNTGKAAHTHSSSCKVDDRTQAQD